MFLKVPTYRGPTNICIVSVLGEILLQILMVKYLGVLFNKGLYKCKWLFMISYGLCFKHLLFICLALREIHYVMSFSSLLASLVYANNEYFALHWVSKCHSPKTQQASSFRKNCSVHMIGTQETNDIIMTLFT